MWEVEDQLTQCDNVSSFIWFGCNELNLIEQLYNRPSHTRVWLKIPQQLNIYLKPFK